MKRRIVGLGEREWKEVKEEMLGIGMDCMMEEEIQ